MYDLQLFSSVDIKILIMCLKIKHVLKPQHMFLITVREGIRVFWVTQHWHWVLIEIIWILFTFLYCMKFISRAERK